MASVSGRINGRFEKACTDDAAMHEWADDEVGGLGNACFAVPLPHGRRRRIPGTASCPPNFLRARTFDLTFALDI